MSQDNEQSHQPDTEVGQQPSGSPVPEPTTVGPGGDARDAAPARAGSEPPFVDRRRGERRVHTVDFSQPTKFTAELRRRIERVLGPFCEAYATRLSSELRAPVELSVADSNQLTWSAAKAQMPVSAVAVALEVQPLERQMLLSVEPSMILRALECLLGGTAQGAPATRRFSEIDWALTRRLLEAATSHLSTAWRDLGGLQLLLGEIDLEGDAGVMFRLGEATFAVTLECRVDGLSSNMSLLIPWSSIEPVADEVLGGGAEPEDADPHDGQALNRGLATSQVQLRAEVGSAALPVERILALTPGTLLALEDRAEDGVQLFAEGVPIGRARPGLRGAHRALKLNAPIEPGPALTMHGATTARMGVGPALLPHMASTDPLDSERAGGERSAGELDTSASSSVGDGLNRMLGVHVRVWAELGRVTLPLGSTLELPPGSVLELDQGAEAPIELFVNGMCFAHGTLQVTAEGDWAVQVDALI